MIAFPKQNAMLADENIFKLKTSVILIWSWVSVSAGI